jgi:zinc-ribbon domain
MSSTQYCPSCGAKLPHIAHFCGQCGHSLKAKIAISKTTNMGHSSSAGAHSVSMARIYALQQKVLSKLPASLQRVITTMLIRSKDPSAEVSHSKHLQTVGSPSIAWGWLPMLALINALGVFSLAYAYTSARNGATQAEVFFWLGLLLIFVPSVVRLLSPGAARFERMSLLSSVSICFYLVSVLFSPLHVSSYDELLHWRTVNDILGSGHLFGENSLLPASPFYPGLEIVTSALSVLSGLSAFYSGVIVIGTARLVMILALFLLYEHLANSARMAGIATIIYMTNPHFIFFDAQFSYEALALPLAVVVMFVLARPEAPGSGNRWKTPIAWIILGAVVVTHHMTDFIFDGLFILWTVTYQQRHKGPLLKSSLAKTALFGVFTSFAWMSLSGNPVVGYLSSYFSDAFDELAQVLTGNSRARQLFSVYAGPPTPLWERAMMASSVALILLFLPFGLLCLWQRYRSSALAAMFGIVSLFYPVSHVFRLTNFGSEIADRSAAFLYIPLAWVLALFITQFWPTRGLNWRQTSLLTCAISVVFLGGFILGAGPPRELLPGPYAVEADARSIEPEGIQAALWARSYLGPDNRVATDRTNSLLMSTYGDQRLVTSIEDNIDVTPIFFSPNLGPYEESILQKGQIRYLVVDLRLSQAPPSVGFYFDPGEPGAFHYSAPINVKALTKFNAIPQVNRLYDSGNIVIYDVGGLVNAPEKP